MEEYELEEMVALEVADEVLVVTATTTGPTTLRAMVLQTQVVVVVVVPETDTSINTLSTAEVIAQETVVPEGQEQ